MFFRPVLFLLSFLIVQLHSLTCVGEKLPVIVSIFPVGDMVQQVGGEHVDVTFMLPPGASPHTFEPRPSLVKKISSARIFFMIGAGLEFWAEKFISQAGPHLTTVVLSKGVSLIHSTGHYNDRPDVSYHKSEAANPHIWLDPEISKSMVSKIVSALIKVDQKHLKYYEEQGQRYMDELDKLDRLIKTTVARFKIKKYVSFHASLDYFARRYGLESAGVIEAAPGRNPTPIQIINIVAMIKKHRIRAVFSEPQLNPRAAEIIAKEADVKVLLLDPMGNPRLKARSTYIDLMRYNLNVLQEAME
jgi:zinc transport system substrate-binding protein